MAEPRFVCHTRNMTTNGKIYLVWAIWQIKRKTMAMKPTEIMKGTYAAILVLLMIAKGPLLEPMLDSARPCTMYTPFRYKMQLPDF